MKYAVLCVILRPGPDGEPEALIGRKETGEIGQFTYNFPGGKIEFFDRFGHVADQGPKHAAKRETYEEMGVTLFSTDLVHQANALFCAGGKPDFLVAVYVAHLGRNSGIKERDTEHMSDVGWRAVSKLPYDLMAEADRHWIPRVIAGDQFDAVIHYERRAEGYVSAEFAAFTGGARFPIPEPLPESLLPLLSGEREQYELSFLAGFEPPKAVLVKRTSPDDTL